jgi:hypothetical protein
MNNYLFLATYFLHKFSKITRFKQLIESSKNQGKGNKRQ